MAILAGDIKLVASQVMDDIAEGGGAPTSTIIVDGASNSLFNDISELDRAGGRVNLRKVFAHVQTPTVDGYFGGNVIVADPPDDPRVSVAIFKAASVFDRRGDAANRIESYLNKGGYWDGYLLENHIAGQRAIQIFARKTATPPTVGKTLYLVQNEDTGAQYYQYVRVTRVSSVARAFSYSTGGSIVDYEAQVITCELSDALLYDFPGSAPSRIFTMETGKTRLRDTLVADASRYYGAARVDAAIDIGDVSASVESIYTRIVPSAQTETPIIDANAAGNIDGLVDAGNGNVSLATSVPFAASANIYLGLGVKPGTLTVTHSGGTLTDSGGELLSGTTVIGLVDYARGLLSFASSAPSFTGGKTVTFAPAAAPTQLADSASVTVGIENRGYNYIQTIVPVPAPGTLTVSYLVAGTWYDLKDNGTGALKGADKAFGVGTISYSTGTVAVTLGALPDAGSEIIYTWGNRVNYINRAAATVAACKVRLQLPQGGITPSTVTVAWNDGAARSTSDDGKGKMTGAATGTINYSTGLIEMVMTNLPGTAQTYTVTFSVAPAVTETIANPTRAGNTVNLTLDNGGVIPGSVHLTFNVEIASIDDYTSVTPATQKLVGASPSTKRVIDDGEGTLKDEAGITFGTVDYVTGAIVLHPDFTTSLPTAAYSVVQIGFDGTTANKNSGFPATGIPVYRNFFNGWAYKTAYATMPASGASVTVKYTAASGTPSNYTFSSAGLALDLTDNYAETIVPGSVLFAFGGKTYFDRGGSLYYDLDVTTGNGTPAGTINYQTGEVALSAWVPGQANSPVVQSLVTTIDGNPVDEVVFRIPVAPVRSGSVQLLATTLTGATINVTANTSGEFIAAGVLGGIDYETGVVRCRFGQWVTAAGNESQYWYSASAVFDGKIFKPAPVFAASIKYNAVAYSYLPLDATILGLNPVRLPQDGRVPIFRTGDYAVIGHTGTAGPFTVSNGQTKDMGRVRLSRIRVLDANGAVINTGYSEDLDAGTVTFTDVTGYAQPVTIEHRIEDMAQVSDVQINGELAFTRQITHAYPVGAYISSALVAGDLKAYVSNLFDQATWSGAWADSLSGSAATATFNDVLAPVEVTNEGAVTERWLIQFTNTTAFNVVGEHVGVIASGNTASDIAPTNPATGKPYFTLHAVGWGSGWAAGNVLRFNTTGAIFPVWAVRTVQQGPETVTNDSFTLLIRGDVDRP